MTAAAEPTHAAAFGVHRHPHLHLRRPHVQLCSKKTALALLCLAQFMVILDVSIVNVALPSVRHDLRVSDSDLQWVVNAYALAFGGLLLLGGRAATVMFLLGCAMFAPFFFLTLYMQQVRGYSPLKAGVVFLPMALGIVGGSAAATELTGRLGPKPPLVAGLGLAALGMLLFTNLSVGGTFVTTLLVPEIAFGVGLGLAFVPATIAAVSGVPAEEAGLASGLINMSRSVGGSLGLAALATVATDRTNHLLAASRPSPSLVHAALTSGFARGFAVGAALALAAALTALFALPGRPSRPLSTEAQPIEVAV